MISQFGPSLAHIELCQVSNSAQLLQILEDLVNEMAIEPSYEKQIKSLTELDNVQFIVFIESEIDQESQRDWGRTRQKKNKEKGLPAEIQKRTLENICCNYCNAGTKNLLLLLFHIHSVHDSQVFKFEVDSEQELLKVIRYPKIIKKDRLDSKSSLMKDRGIIYSNCDIYERMQDILVQILAKVSIKSKECPKNVFYHSTRLFDEIIQGSDSQDDINSNQDLNEKMEEVNFDQLIDITVSQADFMTLWNNWVQSVKVKSHVILNFSEHIVERIGQFFALKEVNLRDIRCHVIVLLNTMWCYGMLTSEQVVAKMVLFNEIEKEKIKSAEQQKQEKLQQERKKERKIRQEKEKMRSANFGKSIFGN